MTVTPVSIASPSTSFTDDELAEISASFESAPASKVIRWAVDTFSPHLCLTASMTDAVLIDLATKVDPGIEVVFIDTGYHFPETLQTVEVVRRRYALNLHMMTVPHSDAAAVDPAAGTAARGQGRPARPRPRRQAGLDQRPAPRRGRQPRRRPRSSAGTGAAW